MQEFYRKTQEMAQERMDWCHIHPSLFCDIFCHHFSIPRRTPTDARLNTFFTTRYMNYTCDYFFGAEWQVGKGFMVVKRLCARHLTPPTHSRACHKRFTKLSAVIIEGGLPFTCLRVQKETYIEAGKSEGISGGYVYKRSCDGRVIMLFNC